MRKSLMIVAATALGIPAAALAKHPATPDNGSVLAKTPTVMFVVHGTVTGYTAASGATNGSISFTFKAANRDGTALQAASQPLAFVVASTTKLSGGKTVATGDQVLVKVRAPKDATVATLASTAAFQVVDQGSGTDSGS